MPSWFRPKALAERWDVSDDTIINMIKRGELLGKKIGGQWRVPAGEVERYERIDGDEPEQVTGAIDEAMRLYADR